MIGSRIQTRRLELHLTMEDLASKIGVTVSTISRWESGKIGSMRVSRLGSLAKALQTTPNDLLGWTDKAISLTR